MIETVDCVDFCRALGDSTRQALLRVLMEDGEQCVGCLVQRFGLSQPTISHHLTLLKRAGLVSSRKVGKQVLYAINQDSMTECCGLLMARFTPMQGCAVTLPVGEAPTARSAEQPFAGERDTK